jgi:hypothetical protein
LGSSGWMINHCLSWMSERRAMTQSYTKTTQSTSPLSSF